MPQNRTRAGWVRPRVARVWKRVSAIVGHLGADPADEVEVRVGKRVLVAVSMLMAVLAVVWGGVYLAYDLALAAAIPWTYSAAVAVSLLLFALTRRYRMFRATQLALILLLPFALQVVLGGFVSASAVIVWSLLAPLGALAMADRRQALGWFTAYVALVAVAQMAQVLVEPPGVLPEQVVISFFVMNIVGSTGVAFFAMYFFVSLKDETLALLHAEREKSDRLLLNVLPAPIADRLKDEEGTIADAYEDVSVLFADLVDFTPMTQRLRPRELVDLLNEIFSHFDVLAARYGLEKIRTNGDTYMVASGVPDSRDDHALALAGFALDVQRHTEDFDTSHSVDVAVRIGIASGPVIAGIIGQAKFQYDIWGDTVNTASRMESHGVPGRIQVNRTAYELLREEFSLEPRGTIEVKGKGPMETWFLTGRV